MMRFTKFLKVEADVVVARNAFIPDNKSSKEYLENAAVAFIQEEFAKANGFKENDVIKITSKGRSVNLKVKISDIAPKNGILIPNGIYASYLTDFDGFKRFKAEIELAEGDTTKPEEIIEKLKE